ncbi:hypothetical protein FF38_06760 [Lucilia cuprina]|uniref:HTH CENPB-type domain-containing protein n=1 Tax=Lucilia cuprina TaxID=7375 RepID=A0A0L0CR56_LUCCU|nr:hypothetical protein CVS40_3861 [Lucilia cuprina]KNC34828.1 hypothetical protein FF38_06760 [Lucilia cuprina]
MKPATRTTTNNNNNNNNNAKDVTITTINDHNKIPRVEKVVFDNRIKRKNVLALNEKVAAIREYEKRPVYKRIGRMFHCSPDQIKRIVQQKDAILNAWEQRTRKCRDAKTLEMKVVKVSMLGKAVYEWIRRMMYYKDILITDGLIQKIALQFKSAMGLQNFFPHPDWCNKFRSTYNIATCDSKLLNIGYTQGHSVQIKDVMKDVLSECSPDHEDGANDDGDDEVECIDDVDEEENGNCENDCISIHSDEGEVRVKTKLRKKITDKNERKANNEVVNSKPVQIMPHAQLQGLRQLVALPIPANGMPGLSQKVLVATPIVAPGQRQGSAPMTMTIIPLASLAQPSNAVNTSTTIAAVAAGSSISPNSNNNCGKDQPVVVPSPMLEIKKEIKEEPKDDDDIVEEKREEEVIKIKKEYLTDDEETTDTPTKQRTTPTIQTNTPTHIVAIPLANKDMLEESTNDSLDDLTLSSLRKRIKTEEPNAEQKTIERNSSPPPLTSIQAATTVTRTSAEIPPMPPLTKAPIQRNNSPPTTSSLKTHITPALTNSTPTQAPSNRSSHKRLRSDEDQQPTLPPIRSYAEGRKYLKLLEDFALERENFRLIGLITRADEVLRELDRKENNEDEDVDID